MRVCSPPLKVDTSLSQSGSSNPSPLRTERIRFSKESMSWVISVDSRIASFTFEKTISHSFHNVRTGSVIRNCVWYPIDNPFRKTMRPSTGVYSPTISLIREVLPEPFAPKRAIWSPSSIWIETFSNKRPSPNPKVNASVFKIIRFYLLLLYFSVSPKKILLQKILLQVRTTDKAGYIITKESARMTPRKFKAQNRNTIVLSFQPSSSKWWCIGLIRNILRWNSLKEPTWRTTLRSSIQ